MFFNRKIVSIKQSIHARAASLKKNCTPNRQLQNIINKQCPRASITYKCDWTIKNVHTLKSIFSSRYRISFEEPSLLFCSLCFVPSQSKRLRNANFQMQMSHTPLIGQRFARPICVCKWPANVRYRAVIIHSRNVLKVLVFGWKERGVTIR